MIEQVFYVFFFSRSPSPQGRPSAPPAHHLHLRSDPEAGAGVPAERVHLAAEAFRARRVARPDGDADQDLVPEPAREGQEDREGADRPPVQVRKELILVCVTKCDIILLDVSRSDYPPLPTRRRRRLRPSRAPRLL